MKKNSIDTFAPAFFKLTKTHFALYAYEQDH
jgi:hypothetical protein